MWTRKRREKARELELDARMIIIAPAVMALLFATGCGGQSLLPKDNSDTLSHYSGGSGGNSGTGGGVPLSNGANGPSGNTTVTGNPPLSFRVGAFGYTSTSVTVSTNHTVRLTFSPGQQDQTIPGTGYSINYSGLGVYITVGNLTQPTALLYNGFANTQAETSAIMDFSSGVSTQCSSSDPSCRQRVTITIAQPNFDYYCINFGYNCPWAHVGNNMPWHGTLRVQTDDTDPLN